MWKLTFLIITSFFESAITSSNNSDTNTGKNINKSGQKESNRGQLFDFEGQDFQWPQYINNEAKDLDEERVVSAARRLVALKTLSTSPLQFDQVLEQNFLAKPSSSSTLARRRQKRQKKNTETVQQVLKSKKDKKAKGRSNQTQKDTNGSESNSPLLMIVKEELGNFQENLTNQPSSNVENRLIYQASTTPIVNPNLGQLTQTIATPEHKWKVKSFHRKYTLDDDHVLIVTRYSISILSRTTIKELSTFASVGQLTEESRLKILQRSALYFLASIKPNNIMKVMGRILAYTMLRLWDGNIIPITQNSLQVIVDQEVFIFLPTASAQKVITRLSGIKSLDVKLLQGMVEEIVGNDVPIIITIYNQGNSKEVTPTSNAFQGNTEQGILAYKINQDNTMLPKCITWSIPIHNGNSSGFSQMLTLIGDLQCQSALSTIKYYWGQDVLSVSTNSLLICRHPNQPVKSLEALHGDSNSSTFQINHGNDQLDDYLIAQLDLNHITVQGSLQEYCLFLLRPNESIELTVNGSFDLKNGDVIFMVSKVAEISIPLIASQLTNENRDVILAKALRDLRTASIQETKSFSPIAVIYQSF